MKRAGSDWWKLHHDDFWDCEDVILMGPLSAGAYLFLLGVQAKHGHLPASAAACSLLLHRWPADTWAELERFFPIGADGRRRNARQADELAEVEDGRRYERDRYHRRKAEKEAHSAGVPENSAPESAGASSLLSSSESESSPVPDPESGKRKTVRAGKPKPPPTEPPWRDALILAPEMDTADVRAACERWRAHRTKRRHPVWDSEQWARNICDYAPFGAHGPARFVAAVENSAVRNKYQSLVEPRGGPLRAVPSTGVEAGERFLERMREVEVVT